MRYRVKKRWPLAVLAVLSSIAGGMYWICFHQVDPKGYETVLARVNPSPLGQDDAPYRTTQERRGVSKEIWFENPNGAWVVKARCDLSELTYETDCGRSVIIECMHPISGSVHHSILGNSRASYRFAAEQVTYYYSSRLVEVDRLRVESDALSSGAAPQVTLTAGKAVCQIPQESSPSHGALNVGLSQGVVVECNQEGRLYAPSADVNLAAGTALLKSSEDLQDPVRFERVLLGKTKGSLEVNCQKALLQLEPPYAIEAEDKVQIFLGSEMQVQCDSAAYEADRILLRKNIVVDWEGKGVLTTDNKLEIDLNLQGDFNTIKCQGDCTFQGKSSIAGSHWSLHCPGEALLDRTQNQVYLKALSQNNGEYKQIEFQDAMGKMYCNSALIAFADRDRQFEVEALLLEGNVRLYHQHGTLVQFAAADRVEYQAETHQVRLVSIKPKRVLLYDQINHLQVSAPEMRLSRDRQTKKEHFQGVGDVRFKFAENEIEEIRKKFNSTLYVF